MRILILANLDMGLYRFRKEFISELLKEHEVYISIPDGEWVEPLIEMGCVFCETPLERRGMNPLTDVKLLNRYRNLVDEISPELVITYTIKPNIYGGTVCRWKKVPYAVNITGLGSAFQKEGILQQLVTVMYRTALKKARVVFTENTGIRDLMIEKKMASEKQICVLNGAGINLEDYPYIKYPENEIFSFLFIGRVMKEKGIDELFQAVRRLNDDGFKCRLHIVGFSEEDYKEKMEEGCREGWLTDYGLQKDVRPFIAAADCFVLPSWHEGMANTNLECAASGRPVITSDIPGCREAVIEGQTGYLCERKNADSLYTAMKRVFLLSHEERESMGAAGRRHMEKVFDKRKVVSDTIHCLFD